MARETMAQLKQKVCKLITENRHLEQAKNDLYGDVARTERNMKFYKDRANEVISENIVLRRICTDRDYTKSTGISVGVRDLANSMHQHPTRWRPVWDSDKKNKWFRVDDIGRDIHPGLFVTQDGNAYFSGHGNSCDTSRRERKVLRKAIRSLEQWHMGNTVEAPMRDQCEAQGMSRAYAATAQDVEEAMGISRDQAYVQPVELAHRKKEEA